MDKIYEKIAKDYINLYEGKNNDTDLFLKNFVILSSLTVDDYTNIATIIFRHTEYSTETVFGICANLKKDLVNSMVA